MNNNCQTDYKQESAQDQRALALSLFFITAFAVVEVLGGLYSGSLALLSDAGHMVTDAVALLLAWLAGVVMRRPPSTKHSFGFARIEVITAFINAIFMLIVIAGIFYEAIHRINHVTKVDGGMVFIIATAGLIVNIIVAYKLSHAQHGHGHSNLNTRAALLHVIGDLLGSVAAIAAGIIIYFTDWTPIDPILSVLICLIILKSAYSLIKETLLVLMEGVPEHIDLGEVSDFINNIPGVRSISDLHIWNLSTGYVALTAHVNIADITMWPKVIETIRKDLSNRYGIKHITIEPDV